MHNSVVYATHISNEEVSGSDNLITKTNTKNKVIGFIYNVKITQALQQKIMPNTHRRRRRDSTVELSRVGVGNLAVCIVLNKTLRMHYEYKI